MKLQLSISLLVSDRQTSAERCLDSLVPILNAIPSELIVVFTGKDPKVRELIGRYTDQVTVFDWCDDFSAARNVGLEQASGEWFMFIDDDEWFDDPSEIIRFFQSGEYRDYYYAAYSIRNYSDWEGKNYTECYVGRMTRLMPETRFMGTIHEYLFPRYTPQKYFSAYIHHYGYMKPKSKRVPNHFERNTLLLFKELEQHTNESRNYMQLVQEYVSIDQMDKAEEYAWKILDLVPKEKECQEKRFVCAFLPKWIGQRGDYRRALEVGEQFIKEQTIAELGKLFLYLHLTQICINLKSYEKLLHYAQLLQKLFDRIDKEPEIWVNQVVLVMSETLAKGQKYSAYVNAVVAATELERYSEVSHFLNLLPWDHENEMKLYYGYLEGWREHYYQQKEAIGACLQNIHTDSDYICFQNALCAQERGNLEDLKKLYERLELCDIFVIQPQILRMAFQNHFSLERFLSQTNLEKWKIAVFRLLSLLDREEYTVYLSYGDVLFSAYPFPLYRKIFFCAIWERMLCEDMTGTEDFETLFSRYCSTVLDYYEATYNADRLRPEELTCAPEEYQFSYWISKVLEHIKSAEHLSDGIQYIKQSMGVYPVMAAAVRRLLGLIQKRLKDSETQGSQEFKALGVQIKEKVQTMVEAGQYQQALPVISQLCQLMPNDLEAMRMKLNIYQMIKK